MEYRELGQSGLKVSAISFGAWAIGGWMWGGAERSDAVAAIRTSYGLGVTSIDTAPIYGQGLSEEIVGEAIQGIPRDRVQILTKFGMRWDQKSGDFAFSSVDNEGREIEVYKFAGRESIVQECENSLRRLRTDYIDLYQIHWPDVTTPIEETMEAVSGLLKQGKIRAAGVCNYSAKQMDLAEKVVNLASNQVPYSMVERSIEAELVPYCIDNGKSILAYSPLQRGLLTGKIQPDHKFAAGDHRPNTKFFKPANIQATNEFLHQLRPLASEKKATLSQIVLRWTIDQPGITVALAGARDARQASENAGAANIRFSAEEMEMINNLLSGLKITG